MMRLLVYSLTALLLAGSTYGGNVEARLIRASNEKAAPEEAVQDIAGKLKKVFGFEHYRQLGKDQKAIKRADPISLNIGEGFTLFCHPKAAAGNQHELDVELYSGKTLLVKQEKLTMRHKNVVFIRGPEVGSTLLIVALTVTE
ncbi:MAG: hypothetical protein PCFJNLEI_01231 [Verrucomicrobiae bacterium]|nr:hypothetical protein [Verrucomicrobiae bacterium]